MIWNVDGCQVEVFITGGSEVEIQLWNAIEKIIYVPASLSNDEVLWTIRNITQEKILLGGQKRYDELHVFDKLWKIEVNKGSGRSYFYGSIIRCYTERKLLSDSLKLKIKQQLLEQILLLYVSTWEDRFGRLVPQVKIRKLASNPFKIDRKSGSISFDKGLHRFQISYIEYCVFESLVHFFHIAEPEQQSYLLKYFPNAKTIHKTLIYEYR